MQALKKTKWRTGNWQLCNEPIMVQQTKEGWFAKYELTNPQEALLFYGPTILLTGPHGSQEKAERTLSHDFHRIEELLKD